MLLIISANLLVIMFLPERFVLYLFHKKTLFPIDTGTNTASICFPVKLSVIKLEIEYGHVPYIFKEF